MDDAELQVRIKQERGLNDQLQQLAPGSPGVPLTTFEKVAARGESVRIETEASLTQVPFDTLLEVARKGASDADSPSGLEVTHAGSQL